MDSRARHESTDRVAASVGEGACGIASVGRAVEIEAGRRDEQQPAIWTPQPTANWAAAGREWPLIRR